MSQTRKHGLFALHQLIHLIAIYTPVSNPRGLVWVTKAFTYKLSHVQAIFITDAYIVAAAIHKKIGKMITVDG